MKRSQLTRRHILAAAAAMPAGVLAGTGDADAELLWLGQEFLRLANEVDQLVDRASPDDETDDQALDQLLADMDVIEDAVLQHKATTVAGLDAKARIVHWAKCQDLNPDDLHYLADKMMLSLIRDLIALQGASSDPESSPTKEGIWT